MKAKNLTGGFMPMIYAVLGLVLVTTMFSSIMTGLAAILAIAGISSLVILSTIVGIAPTILLLAVTGGGAWGWAKGYQQGSANDSNGLMRVVLSILQLVLFITLFATIATSFVSLYISYGTNTTWIAFGTVVSIVPAILFLAGIASSIAMFVTGARTYAARGRRSVS